jgi:alpha-tubulin suppressor-like RCC1 family protein
VVLGGCGGSVESTHSTYRTASTGYSYSCAIRDDGSLWCWGGGWAQEHVRTHPGPIGSDTDWTDVWVGWLRTCALKQDGSLWCWSIPEEGARTYPIPAYVEPLKSTRLEKSGARPTELIQGDGEHLCFFDAERALWCWGYNGDGELGNGSTKQPETYQRVEGGPWKKATVGGFARGGVFGGAHTCAIKADNTLWCWGSNQFGMLGIADSFRGIAAVTRPAQVEGQWIDVSTETMTTIGIRTDGTLWAWGFRHESNASKDAHWQPEQISADTDWASLASGRDQSCALKKDGSAWCWGYKALGTGTKDRTDTPRRVQGNVRFSRIDVGSSQACALATDNTVWCWGEQKQYELGDGTTETRNAPVQIAEPLGM